MELSALSLALTRAGLISSSVAFSPLSLFAAGEQGVYFDPNNSATLFEDAAGTIPTALERPVGAMLDLRDTAYSTYFDGVGDYLAATSANFALGTGDFTIECWSYLQAHNDRMLFGYASSNANGIGVLADAAISRRIYIGSTVKLYATGAGFPLNAWFHLAVVRQAGVLSMYQDGVSIGSVADSTNLTATAFQIGASLYNNLQGYISNFRIVKGTALYTANFTPPTGPLTAVAGTSLLTCGTSWVGNPTITAVGDSKVKSLNPFTSGIGNHATSSSTARPTLTRRVNQFVNSEVLATQSVTTRATTQTLQFEGTGTITLSGTATGVYTAGTYSVTTTAGTLTATVLGTVTRADLREANTGVGLPAYQRVGNTAINAADYDTTGFPAWLRCSGGQSMVTPSINFAGTDKMTVWAGVRKLSDASAFISELSATSATNAGAFALFSGAGGAANYAFGSGGSLFRQDTQSATINAPNTSVLSGVGNISGNQAILRVNGTQASVSTTNQGSGNFGNYPLYLFARNQASLFFNGLAGPIIVRGAQSSSAEIANAENWINAQQKVY